METRIGDDHPLFSSFSKVDRARTKLTDISRHITCYKECLTFKLIGEKDNTDLVHIKIKTLQKIPVDLQHGTAELIYQLRSALDHMLVSVAQIEGLNDTRHIQFPFCEHSGQFHEKRVQNRLKGLSSKVIDLIYQFSPWEKKGNKYLWGLGSLANVDKHNVLIPFVLEGDIGGSNGDIDGGGHPNSVGILVDRGNLISGVTISRIGVAGHFKVEEISIHPRIGFGEQVNAFSYCEAIPTLEKFIETSEEIIKKFAVKIEN